MKYALTKLQAGFPSDKIGCHSWVKLATIFTYRYSLFSQLHKGLRNMTMTIVTTAANLAADSLTIPLATLNAFGLASGEYANTVVGIQRALIAALKAVAAEPFGSVIGLSRPAAVTQAVAGTNLINTTFSLTETLVGNLTVTPTTLEKIPLPSSGTNSGVGGLAIADIFAGADIQGSGTSVTNVLAIPTEDLAFWGSDISSPSTNVGTGADNRIIIGALYKLLAMETEDANVVVRTASVSSSIVGRTITAPAQGTLPANATATTNPTTGIDPTHRVIAVSSTMTITFQQVLNQTNDTIDVNFATA